MSEKEKTRFRVLVNGVVSNDTIYGIGEVRRFVKNIKGVYKVESFTKGEWRPVKV